MRRREFITMLGGAAAAWPLGGQAQQTERIRRIGVLVSTSESDREGRARVARFREELQKLGWAEGRNTRIDYRWGALDAGSAQRFAKELAALQPDVILTSNTPTTMAMLQETRIIPIIFVNVADPMGSGLVASFSRPGGNVTGFTNIEPTMAGKWLELLKEIAPHVTRVGTATDEGRGHRAGQQTRQDGVGDDGQGRTLQAARGARGLNEIAPDIRRDVTVGRANST